MAAGLAIQTQAPVAPIYLGGTNSVFFQLSGLIHPRLRTMQLPGELLKKRGATIDVRIGSLVHPADLARCGSPKSATAYLRARTYMLAHRNQEKTQGLWEFHNKPPALDSHAAPIAPETPDIAAEIDTLEGRGCKLLENASYVVYAEQGERIPRVLREIGRLRELTFRTAGEGTGRSLDLDEFEKYYTHLILWHKQKSCICGAYRMAWTEDVLPIYGKNGLYTSTLFAYEREFFRVLGPAVELGRSFIRPEFQRDYAPLLMLWQAVGRCVAARPQAPVLFGAVSISANYSDAAVKLMVEYLRQRRLRADLAPLVRPRRPFRPRVTYAAEICEMAARLGDIEELAKPLSDIGGPSHVPVLLRHYVRLGGRVTGFHVDRNFSNAIDALLVVDLRETAPKLLVKYMGPDGAAEFMRRKGYGACA
ncbi:MAG: lysophospholipid acyltransferase family protein [Acidobacteriaceae bacterium]|nr:lysophospholipid acyltransferase family protein [Acidobacteriaceae bacterium]